MPRAEATGSKPKDQLPEVLISHLRQIPGLNEPVSNRFSCIKRMFCSLRCEREKTIVILHIHGEQTGIIHKILKRNYL